MVAITNSRDSDHLSTSPLTSSFSDLIQCANSIIRVHAHGCVLIHDALFSSQLRSYIKMLPSTNRKLYNEVFGLINRQSVPIQIQPYRTKYYHNRHRDPKYRVERTRKVWKLELPDFDKERMSRDKDNLSPDQIRTEMKERGIAPPNLWPERDLFSACTMSLMEPYQVPGGDGKSSSLLSLKSSLSKGKDFVKNRNAVSTIKSFEGDDFSIKDFAKESLKIYKKAHELLAAKDEKNIFDYVTEYCFPLMVANMRGHTINWNYLGEVEEPYVVQTRVGDMATKGNKYAQITVRLHTKQLLAIYDRHGRLVHGSPVDVKEVLEHVIFEKYLANEYGLWRLHGKLRFDSEGLDIGAQVSKTFVVRQ